MLEINGIEQLRFDVSQRRVMILTTLPQIQHNKRRLPWCNTLQKVGVSTESDDPVVLLEALTSAVKESTDPMEGLNLRWLPEYHHEVYQGKNLPHFGDELIVGFQTAVEVTVKGNPNVLTSSGVKLGFCDATQVVLIKEDIPPVYLYGVELNEESVAPIIKNSRALYDLEHLLENQRTSSKRRSELGRLTALAHEGDFTAYTFAQLDGGVGEHGPMLNCAIKVPKTAWKDGFLQLLPGDFRQKPYTFMSLVPDAKRALRYPPRERR